MIKALNQNIFVCDQKILDLNSAESLLIKTYLVVYRHEVKGMKLKPKKQHETSLSSSFTSCFNIIPSTSNSSVQITTTQYTPLSTEENLPNDSLKATVIGELTFLDSELFRCELTGVDTKGYFFRTLLQ